MFSTSARIEFPDIDVLFDSVNPTGYERGILLLHLKVTFTHKMRLRMLDSQLS